MNTDRVTGQAKTSLGRLQEDYGRFAGDDTPLVDGLRSQTEGQAQQLYGQAKDGLRDAVDRASAFAETAYDQGRRRLGEGADAVNAQVEANPVVAIMLAAAVGYLLGLAYRARLR